MYQNATKINIFKSARLWQTVALALFAISYPILLRAYNLAPKDQQDWNGLHLQHYWDWNTALWTISVVAMPLIIAVFLFIFLPKHINRAFFVALASVIVFQFIEVYDAIDYEVRFDDFNTYHPWYWLPFLFFSLVWYTKHNLNQYRQRQQQKAAERLTTLSRSELEQLIGHYVKVEQGLNAITPDHDLELSREILIRYTSGGIDQLVTKINQLK